MPTIKQRGRCFMCGARLIVDYLYSRRYSKGKYAYCCPGCIERVQRPGQWTPPPGLGVHVDPDGHQRSNENPQS